MNSRNLLTMTTHLPRLLHHLQWILPLHLHPRYWILSLRPLTFPPLQLKHIPWLKYEDILCGSEWIVLPPNAEESARIATLIVVSQGISPTTPTRLEPRGFYRPDLAFQKSATSGRLHTPLLIDSISSTRKQVRHLLSTTGSQPLPVLCIALGQRYGLISENHDESL